MCLLCVACSKNTPTKIPSDTLIIGIEAPIRNLDLRTATDTNAVQISRLMAQFLVRVSPEQKIEMDLATRVQELHQSRVFLFDLQTTAVFHDGSPVRSNDVVASLLQAASSQSRVRSAFEGLVSIHSPKEHQVELRFKNPRPGFLLGDAPNLLILPERFAKAPSLEFQKNPIASGPYRFVKRTHRDLIFERHESYLSSSPPFQRPLPSFRRVVVRSIQDPATRFLSLLGGDIDILFSALSPRRVVQAQGIPTLSVTVGEGSSFQYIGLNQRLTSLQNSQIRRALFMALPREELIQHKLFGFASAATSVLPPSNPFFNSSIELPGQNALLAKSLVHNATQGKGLDLELKTSADRDIVSIASVVAQAWNAIGVRTKVRSIEFGSFFSDIQKGAFETFMLRWTSVVDPEILYQLFHSSQIPPGRNRIFYSNPEVDALLAEGRVQFNPQKRREAFLKAQTYISRDLAYLPLWYPKQIIVHQKSLQNVVAHPSGSWFTVLWANKGTH